MTTAHLCQSTARPMLFGSPPMTNIWDGKIRLVPSKMAYEFGGLLERALEAAGMALP